jgi:phosphoglycolate phosphatase-like HAD superfamily hydrolase
LNLSKDIKAILFDLDGTLIDTRNRFYLVFNKSLENFGLPVLSKKVFEGLYSNASLDSQVPEELAVQFWDYFLENYSKNVASGESSIPGSKKALHQLKKLGLSIGVVTGRIASVESVWSELKRYELDQFVDIVLTRLKEQNRNETYFSKEQNLLKALSILGHSPPQSMYVGDYVADIRSGKSIGAVTVAVLSGGIKKEILAKENPNFILESVAKLPPILMK